MSTVKHLFGHFVTIVRVCLLQYKQLQYVANEIRIAVKKARKYNQKGLNPVQMKMNLDSS